MLRMSLCMLQACLGVLAVCATALAAQPDTAPSDHPAIRLLNYRDGDTIQFPVPLLRGELNDPDATSITIVNKSSTRSTRELKGLARQGRFKALAELLPGSNQLVIQAGGRELALTLNYQPQTSDYFVRCIYLTDSSGNTAYQSPIENDPQDFAAKLDTAMKILQTFTAERNHDLGFGRRTFKLELDENGKLRVHVFQEPKPAEFYYQLNDGEWWGRVAEELEPKLPTRFAKNVAIAAYTRFDPASGKVHGHTALGGGGLALFGSGNLFTWPSSLQDVQPAFMDTRAIDPKRVFSDSVFRHTFWAAASTTLGATLHELSHTFGLPHTREPMDIMTRGFDQFNRAFTFVDPPSAANRQAIVFKEDQVACFPPISATALVASRWLAMTRREFVDGGESSARIDGQNLVIRSDADITYVGFSVAGDAVYYLVPPKPIRRMVIPIADLRAHVKSDQFNVRIIDNRGQISTHDQSLQASSGPQGSKP